MSFTDSSNSPLSSVAAGFRSCCYLNVEFGAIFSCCGARQIWGRKKREKKRRKLSASQAANIIDDKKYRPTLQNVIWKCLMHTRILYATRAARKYSQHGRRWHCTKQLWSISEGTASLVFLWLVTILQSTKIGMGWHVGDVTEVPLPMKDCIKSWGDWLEDLVFLSLI